MGYLICDIQSYSLGVRGFVRAIEEILILTAADYGISAHRDDNNPGVWVQTDKLAAIGLHISNGVTQHGFAFNLNPKLNDYRHIVACGLPNHGVTSLEKILGQVPPRQTVIAKLLQHTGEILHTRLKYASSGRGNIPRREPNPPRELSDEYKRP